MPAPSRHALIAGAGIFGTNAALELRARGWRVQLLDRSPKAHPRASSTDVSKVIRMDYGADRFYSELAGDAMVGWAEWNRRFGRPLFHQAGFLLLSQQPFETGGFEEDSFRLLKEMGRGVKRISPKELRARFPAWSADRYPDGYLNPDAGWAESGAVVDECLGWCDAAGVERLNGELVSLNSGTSTSSARVRTPYGEIEIRPDLIVLATGAWTPQLLPELGLGIAAKAMPVVHLKPKQPDLFTPERFPVWGADIARTGWYGFPLHPNGFVKVGHHGRGWDDDPETAETLPEGFEDRLRLFLAESLPGLADAEVVHRRVCFYSDARDGSFWIDRVPGRPGVLIAGGGSGHGFKFGPIIGDLIANAAEGVADPRLARMKWRPDATPSQEDARSSAEV